MPKKKLMSLNKDIKVKRKNIGPLKVRPGDQSVILSDPIIYFATIFSYLFILFLALGLYFPSSKTIYRPLEVEKEVEPEVYVIEGPFACDPQVACCQQIEYVGENPACTDLSVSPDNEANWYEGNTPKVAFPLTAYFRGNGSDPDSSASFIDIKKFVLDFGDGTQEVREFTPNDQFSIFTNDTNTEIEHNYTSAPSGDFYTATLTFYDYDGNESDSCVVNINKAPELAASVDLEKSTNGEDADDPPGPEITVGDAVVWKYVVKNTGDVNLSSIEVSDSEGVSVLCPSSSLVPGDSMTCEASSSAVLGQYENIATVTANPDSPGLSPVSDSDSSHYTGVSSKISSIKFTKYTKITSDPDDLSDSGWVSDPLWEDAKTPPGPQGEIGQYVSWKYVIENTGNTLLKDFVIRDEGQNSYVTACSFDREYGIKPGFTEFCGLGPVLIDESFVGQYENLAWVEATPDVSGADRIREEDLSHFVVEPVEEQQHLSCVDNACVTVSGAGDDACATDDDCTASPAYCTNVSFDYDSSNGGPFVGDEINITAYGYSPEGPITQFRFKVVDGNSESEVVCGEEATPGAVCSPIEGPDADGLYNVTLTHTLRSVGNFEADAASCNEAGCSGYYKL